MIITISKIIRIKLNTEFQIVNTTTKRKITVSSNNGIRISRIRTITKKLLIKTLLTTTSLNSWILWKLTK